MAKTPYVFRKLSLKDQRVLAKYTSDVGRIVWASNSLHAKFALIFIHIIASDQENRVISVKRQTAHAMWHSLRSDDIQRTVLQAAASMAMRSEAKETKSLLWSLKAAGKLSEFRNDAVHTAFEFRRKSGKWVAEPNDYAGTPSRVEKLNRVGHQKLFRLVLGDLIQLRIYVETLYVKLAIDARLALPRRPLLRSIQLVQQNPPGSSKRQPQKARRKRQRRPSGA